jgi:hypothetical protein
MDGGNAWDCRSNPCPAVVPSREGGILSIFVVFNPGLWDCSVSIFTRLLQYSNPSTDFNPRHTVNPDICNNHHTHQYHDYIYPMTVKQSPASGPSAKLLLEI